MNEILGIIGRIKKAAALENKMGYKNAAVFGGFSAFVVTSLEKVNDYVKKELSACNREINEFRLLMKEYAGHEKPGRESLVNKLLRLAAILEKELHSDLRLLKSIGPKRLKLLNKMGIKTVQELLYHFPRRYEDRSRLKKFHQLRDGETETVMGRVAGCQDLRPRRGLTITKAALHDGTSLGYAVWFNQPYIKKQIPPGTEMLVTGKVERKFGGIQITVTDFETLDKDDPIHTGRIVPVYPATEGLPTRGLRTIMKNAVDGFVAAEEEFLPEGIMKRYGFLNLPVALSAVHFPESMEVAEEARRRFIFEELFLLQLGVGLIKSVESAEPGIVHKKSGPLTDRLMKTLPFPLTGAQKRVLQEIYNDMEEVKPMNRLVQGDVGSGKTIIAAAALVKTVESGYQGTMMAPTEILAGQHFDGLRELLQPLGIEVDLLTGSLVRSEKRQVMEDIKEGRVDIVVGTHAVIQDEVEFRRLGLAVTDEQHRFGVKQRAKLKEKGSHPDVLVMTATPIPRTLALTVYGDLDISVIDQLPPGRRPVRTYWINDAARKKVYKFIREQVSGGRQVYYVCPLVEESDKIDVQAAVELAARLREQIFPELRVGLMHGRLKQDEKDTVMRLFKNGAIDILVATTVVEVGVDVPNATVIVIEDADRFGLAQLHQLRGRVGRGAHQSYCILTANPATEEGRARMDVMQSTCDGFVIAEEDLKLRGPGEFFGTRQSGIPDLKIADIIRDVKVLLAAREVALKLLKEDPALDKPGHLRLRQKLKQKFEGTDNYIKIS